MNNFNSKKYIESLFLQEANYQYKREIFDVLYNKLKEINISLIGLRQIGKTTLMIQLAKKYYDEFIKNSNIRENLILSTSSDKEKIFYLNIKSISNINDEENRNKLFNEISNRKYKLVVLDEIQEINNWTNFLQSAIDLNKECKFIVSGSNASGLCDELMVGRVKNFYINPLLYNEYLAIWSLNDDEKNMLDYLKFGSLPKSNNYLDPEIQYKEITEASIIDKIIFDDLKLKPDMNKFKNLLMDINNYIGNEISASEIERNINVSRQTVADYINMMIKARLIHSVSKYKDKETKRKKKIYYEDKSLIYLFSKDESLNNNLFGSLIENVVFNYLYYYIYSTDSLSEINYYRNRDNKEIDFVIENQKLLIEVKYVKDLNPDKLSKELNEIIKQETSFNDFKKIVISYDINEENVNGWRFVSIDNFLKGKIWN